MPGNRLRIVVLTVCIALFIAVGIGVKRHAWTATDTAVAEWFEAHITPVRTAFAFTITQAGSDPFIFAVTAVVALWLRRRSRYWLKRLLITVIGGTICNEVLKFVFYRKRPQFSHPLLHLETNSFPSGHTLAATVLYGTLMILVCTLLKSRLARLAVILLGTALILFVGASRIYLGVHYFSDVIGGILEGVAWITGVGWMLARKRIPMADRQRFGAMG